MKIIAFSLFGEMEKYRIGLLQNLAAAEKIYPDWVCFVYCDEVNFIALEGMAFANARIILQQQKSDGVAGMAWRLLACKEPSATAVIFRDTDSILGQREKDIVDEWLRSDRDVHLIRDHPLHFSPVMGGMFGVKGPAIELLSEMIDRYHGQHRQNSYGDDQAFLNQRFYPKIKHTALVHTTCIRYVFEYALPIRACQNGELFIGAYEFAAPAEQDQYIQTKNNTPPMTRLPHNWERKRMLKILFKRIKFKRIKYGCLWCI